ncbi:cell envelope integrity protein TolA [Vibrio albus]|uniref:Cell envelope integrity protein TolA n=1 Tax=Vibrio albus TaxID=2200953 RepID=A0A2U3BAX2_9VIBR|nr:cell envelope integrity protein TolA [Vibrio albus]PWI33949.1 cell envelope integrity protein TolA [Vibrio albus]
MKNDNNYKSAIAISLVLHLALLAVLIWGSDFSMSQPKPTGNMVQAVVIDPQLVQRQAREIRQQREAASKAEQERLDKLRKQSELLEKNRREEEERIRKLKEDKARAEKEAREATKQRKLEQERVRKEQEKIKQEKERLRREQELTAKAEAERKQKQEAIRRAEEERLAKQAAIEKAEKERLAREKAAQEAKAAAEKAERERVAKEKAAKKAAEKARKEQERLKRLERERKEQEAALGDIFSGLETESVQNSAAKQRHVASEKERYGAIYTQLIQNNLLMEDSFRGKSCKVSLRLLPTGSGAILSNVSVMEGDSRLCSATKRAVAQVNSFPLPADKEIVDELKNIILTVIPE